MRQTAAPQSGTMALTWPRTRALLEDALAGRAFPAAVMDVGRTSGPVWQEAFGALTYDADAPPATLETIFDLASLTKVIATATLTMRHVDTGGLRLDASLADILPGWRHPGGHCGIHVRHLLDHSAGFPGHVRLYESMSGRAAYEAAIRCLAPGTAPGIASEYSDVGFMLLGFLLETWSGAPLDQQFAAISSLLDGEIVFCPPTALRPRIAPTEIDPWRGRLLQGEVHDENAAALGGVAGHAGLFGTGPAVGAFGRLVLRTFRERTPLGAPDLMRTFARRTDTPGSRALGWDTMLPTSSCGTKLSAAAIGHTGFTGTSLWIDPTQDLYVAVLTNRVHPTRANDALVALRPRLHDAIVEEIGAQLG
jgi:CubicO group peptidase (beta-lactamase class C family)